MGVRSKGRASLDDRQRAMLDGLVCELGPRLVAYVHRVYANRQDSEDIVAEAFCRAADNVAALSASSRPDLYLLTIARNLCRDRFRRRRPEAASFHTLGDRADGGIEPAQHVVRDEQRRALQRAVADLPESMREVVVLRISSGLKFEEIAELLQIPLGTALSRMHTALERLRKTLDPAYEH